MKGDSADGRIGHEIPEFRPDFSIELLRWTPSFVLTSVFGNYKFAVRSFTPLHLAEEITFRETLVRSARTSRFRTDFESIESGFPVEGQTRGKNLLQVDANVRTIVIPASITSLIEESFPAAQSLGIARRSL
jgi:hypothetical protein